MKQNQEQIERARKFRDRTAHFNRSVYFDNNDNLAIAFASHAAAEVLLERRTICGQLKVAHDRVHCIGKRGVGDCGVCDLIARLHKEGSGK